MIKYTRQNLETQLKLTNAHLINAQKNLSLIKSPEWELAATYGEGVRVNHINTVNRNIVFFNDKIADIQSQITEL